MRDHETIFCFIANIDLGGFIMKKLAIVLFFLSPLISKAVMPMAKFYSRKE
jgi:hypothetical protein